MPAPPARQRAAARIAALALPFAQSLACRDADPDRDADVTVLTDATNTGTDSDTDGTGASDTGGVDPSSPFAATFTVVVTLDGAPAPDTLLRQPGTERAWITGADGRATVDLDAAVVGEWFVVASHPDARILGAYPPVLRDPPEDAELEEVAIRLTRFDRSDNEAYAFQDPGTPDRRFDTTQCAHCHETIGDDWWASPHRSAASNPAVHDLYAGAAAAFADARSCAAAGGRWWTGIAPGTGAPADRCYVGDGALPALNPGCGLTEACDGAATAFGGCADCHAPGIDGALGGRDLLDATGFAYEDGVHCDVCHKVDAVDLAGPPGVAGRLALIRPSEPPPAPGLGDWHPLTFGPYDDVPHVRMGSVARELFHEPELCAGCHQLDQAVLAPGASADPARWPDGRLPVQSTWAEWLAGPMNPDAPCASCHMPPDPSVGNSADLGNLIDLEPGVAAGWFRPPGAVRRHAWYGPRQRDSGMLELAATVDVDEAWLGAELEASVTVTNVGPGHALPTGEPLRSLVLLVEASCDGVPQPAIGGDAVPDLGGYVERRDATEDWLRWGDARPGDVVRVVRRTGAFVDYTGYGPFGDGTFDAEQKGLPVEEVVGSAVITGITGGVAGYDRPLPPATPGAVAYLDRPGALPADGAPAVTRAGAPGFAFARVLVGADGRRMVPHFLAVDVASDNRLLPQQAFTSHHRFAPSCADPVVSAVLVHRAYPLDLAAERGWALVESVMARVDR